jgi:uncharacterized protein (DUF58 family)
MKKRQFLLFELILDSFRFALTDLGKLLMIGFLIAVLVGSVTFVVPIYHIFTILFSLLAGTFFAALIFWPRLHIVRNQASKGIVGQTITGRFQIHNVGHLPCYDVSLSYFDLPTGLQEIDPERIIRRVGSGDTTEFEIKIKPLRRGLYEVRDPRHYSTFPFNIFRAGPRIFQSTPLLILPSFTAMDKVEIPISSRFQPGGIVLTSNVGESPEYIGNRAYRPGDPLRRIDSKAWARLAQPVVREYQEEYYSRVGLVLDTFIPPRRHRPPEGFPTLEAGISLTAAVADAMSRGEYIIDIFAAGPDLYVFRTGRHTVQLDNVLEILACIKAHRRNPFSVVAPALSDELTKMSAVIFVLLDWDLPREELVRAAVEAGCSTKVVIVREKPCSSDFHAAENWAGHFQIVTPEDVKAGRVDQL